MLSKLSKYFLIAPNLFILICEQSEFTLTWSFYDEICRNDLCVSLKTNSTPVVDSKVLTSRKQISAYKSALVANFTLSRR